MVVRMASTRNFNAFREVCFQWQKIIISIYYSLLHSVHTCWQWMKRFIDSAPCGSNYNTIFWPPKKKNKMKNGSIKNTRKLQRAGVAEKHYSTFHICIYSSIPQQSRVCGRIVHLSQVRDNRWCAPHFLHSFWDEKNEYEIIRRHDRWFGVSLSPLTLPWKFLQTRAHSHIHLAMTKVKSSLRLNFA